MNRIKQLQSKLKETEGYIFLSPVGRQYLTGVATSYGLVQVTKNDCIFYTDFRYLELAEQRARQGVEVVRLKGSLHDALREIADKYHLEKLLLEKDYITQETAETFKDLPVAYDDEKILEKMRMVKDEEEIAAIRAAQAITDKTFSDILPEIRRGMTEKEVMAKLIYLLYHNGADKLSFEPIVVSGANGALPHGVATEKKLADGEFLTMDFGVVKDGYCSDMTRTVAIGRVTDEMKKVYDTVLAAQKAAFSAIRAGVTGIEVDAAARKVVNAAGYEGCFDHGTGHGVGIEIHEAPNYSPRATGTVPAGAVLSVEPGIYLSGRMGVRIEDIALVTENGYEDLTSSDTSLIILQ